MEKRLAREKKPLPFNMDLVKELEKKKRDLWDAGGGSAAVENRVSSPGGEG